MRRKMGATKHKKGSYQARGQVALGGVATAMVSARGIATIPPCEILSRGRCIAELSLDHACFEARG
jgi:hypothetical protein